MDAHRRRVELAEAIGRSWNGARIPYAVVHGLERYPSRLGRDLDLVIRHEHVPLAAEAAIEHGRVHGFSTVLLRWSHWGLYQLALVDSDTRTSLPLDFLCTTGVWRAKWVRMIDEASLDRLVRSDARIGPFRASAEGTFLKSCVRPLLCGDLSRFGDEWPLPVAVPPSVEHEHLLELVGPAGLRLLELSSLDELRCEFPEGMRSMQRAWISSHPLGALRSLLDAATGRALRRLANGADLVLIETPRPESVLRALEAMVPEARRMFIELKPTLAPRAGLERAWRAAIDWRPPPISEFVVTAAVANGVTSPRPEEGLRTTTSDSSLSNRMRSRLRPDLVLRVPPVAHDRMQELLRARLLDFLSRKYRPRWELAGTTPDKALVC